jgi:hypothetical protein
MASVPSHSGERGAAAAEIVRFPRRSLWQKLSQLCARLLGLPPRRSLPSKATARNMWARPAVVPPGAAAAKAGRAGGNPFFTMPRSHGRDAQAGGPRTRIGGQFMGNLERSEEKVIPEVTPFPVSLRRPVRPARAGETRGEVLLFTGVRYDRAPEPNPEPSPSLSSGQTPRRRRRP